jgi:hypothetical protein
MALMAITCGCGHVGVVPARKLPRDVTCSCCGSVRLVEQSDGQSITDKAGAMASAWHRYNADWDKGAQRLRRIEQRKQHADAERAKVYATFGITSER